MIETFKNCKSIAYGILSTLLDSYIPLAITIYSVTFKTNQFDEFEKAMARIWCMFLCFYRRHYNKSPLVWFSNLLFWKENNNELYNTLKSCINIEDEYPVENCHSIIRGSTNSWDMPEQLSFKAKSIFASKKRQHNFRSYFTPPKSFTFSRKELKSLKFKCAEILVNKIFVPIASELDTSKIIPSSLPKNSPILPLGFHTEWPPVSNRICDMPGCLDRYSVKPWVRFNGFWHSFHIDCLQGSNICKVCTAFLKRQIRKLSDTATQAIFNPVTCEDDHNDDNENENNENVDIQQVSDADINTGIQNLIESLARITPPSPTTASSSSISLTSNKKKKKKIAHCKTCSHPIQGHKRPKDSPPKCPHCPSGLCSEEGKTNKCTCSDHTNQVPAIGDKFNKQETGNITAFLLDVSQADLADGIGSNACTVIFVYTAFKFLRSEIEFDDGAVNKSTITHYTEFMIEGNTIYDIINPPVIQPNLFVEEVIKTVDFPFECPTATDIIIITDEAQFEHEIKSKFISGINRKAMVMIAPMDKSMVICSGNNYLYLFESHKHQDKGALIAQTTVGTQKNLLTT